jgi:hypothetical protein
MPAPFRHFRRTKLLAKLLSGSGFLLAAAWFSLDRYAEQRLNAALDGLTAAGLPARLEDYAITDVPRGDNAAVLLGQADMAIVAAAPPIASAREAMHWECLAWDRPGLLDELVGLNRSAIELIRESVRRPRIDWGVRFNSPVALTTAGPLDVGWNLSRLLQVTARREHVGGDHAEAVRLLRLNLALGNRFVQERDFGYSVTSASRIRRTTAKVVERMLPEFDIAPHDAPADLHQVCRQDLEALRDELLDEREINRTWAIAIDADRISVLDAIENLSGRIFQPMFRLDAVRAIGRSEQMRWAVSLDSWPEYQAAAPVYRETGSAFFRASRWASTVAMSFLNAPIEFMFLERGWRRLAATAIAIRLYQLDNGRRPARLEDLVPHYLPAVPRDPYAADGSAIRLGRGGTLLYCVGENGVDEGGLPLRVEGGPADRPQFYLDGDRPRSLDEPPLPGSVQSVPGNGNGGGGEGNADGGGGDQ